MKTRQPSGRIVMVPVEETSAVELVLPEGRAFDAVGRLVAAGVCARHGVQLDRVEGLQRALDVLRHRRRATGSSTWSFTDQEGDVRVDVGPVECPGHAASLEGVLSSLVDDVARDPIDSHLVLRVASRHAEGE